MDLRHLHELATVEDTYWWHRAKRALVLELLKQHCPPPGRLIEGGLGAGGNLRAFAEAGYQVSGFDLMPEAVAHCRQCGLAEVCQHDLQEPWPVPAQSARAIVLLDVIEHTPDPVGILRHAAQAVAPGGGIVVTVPAYPWLMGPWDEMLGHHRRYTAGLLREQARAAGLRVAWLSHWNAFTLPAAIVVRGSERIFRRPRGAEFPAVSPRVNTWLSRCAAWERRWLRHGSVALGLSLVGVLKR